MLGCFRYLQFNNDNGVDRVPNRTDDVVRGRIE